MEERNLTDTYVKETLIGIAAGSFSVVVIVAFTIGGGFNAIETSLQFLVFSYIAPIIYLPLAPWLIVLYVLTGAALYFQYRRVPPRFVRYIVGAEVIVWQLIGFWLITNLFTYR